MADPLQWIVAAFRKWVLRQSGCWPNCPLCAVDAKCEAHYESCAGCQGADYPCPEMRALNAEAEAVWRVLFPDEPTNGSTVEPVILPPWDLSK